MVMVADPIMLTGFSLFRNLSEKELARFAGRLHPKTFAPGTNIMTAEQPGEVVYFILSGSVKIHIEQSGGADVILAILGRGDTVGEMSLIDSAGRSASVLTLEETTVLWMDSAAFQLALREIPEFAFNLVLTLVARVRLCNELIQALGSLNVYGRIARQLLAFAEKGSGPGADGHTRIPIRLTQKDIADLVGASRKRVNQVMVSFKNQGLISVDSDGWITVHQREGLARYCE
jgi:CRP/FNR family transcriptional regulator, cyclic AMP receptor protein